MSAIRNYPGRDVIAQAKATREASLKIKPRRDWVVLVTQANM
jgi:hypothetical protein